MTKREKTQERGLQHLKQTLQGKKRKAYMAHAKVAFTYDKCMLSTHCDDCPVDDPQ